MKRRVRRLTSAVREAVTDVVRSGVDAAALATGLVIGGSVWIVSRVARWRKGRRLRALVKKKVGSAR